MKYSKRETISRVHKIPEIRFEDQRITSFAGLIILQPLFRKLRLKERLRGCFSHIKKSPIIGYHTITLLLIIHLMIGYRKLRDIEYCKEDPMIKRLLGLNRIPDVSTVSRALAEADQESIEEIRQICRWLVIERVKGSRLLRLTFDFDGSVLSTSRKAEGTAVGFNKKKKGQRSYYPLFCTIAQTGQVFDVYHRPGNVHDSKGAKRFIRDCITILKEACPWIKVEARLDSAFFSDAIVMMLDGMGVEFSISVPFERFAELKKMIEGRKRWKKFNEKWSYFGSKWKPKKWDSKYRFIFIRQKVKKLYKEPIQLDMFIPSEYGYDFKVIVTNKETTAKKVLMFHNGRGSQEGVFGELKSQGQMDYIAVRKLHGNQLYMMSAIMAHNLNREIQMLLKPKSRGTTEKRAPLWEFEEIDTIRHRLLQRGGRFTMPKGKLTLTMNANKAVKSNLLHILDALGGLQKAA
ncbi:MAG: IS1380 family transposase [Gammaproteobacteria bacterium]|nr:IS1380 family transposase [Gammaproteobacteria bacterium]